MQLIGKIKNFKSSMAGDDARLGRILDLPEDVVKRELKANTHDVYRKPDGSYCLCELVPITK